MPTAIAYDTARAIIGDDVNGVPVVYANEWFEPPADADMFLRMGVRGSSNERAEVGPAPVWIEDGTIEILIFSRIGTGTTPARVLSDAIMERFRLSAPPPFIEWLSSNFEEADAEEGGDAWFVMILSVVYRVQTTITA